MYASAAKSAASRTKSMIYFYASVSASSVLNTPTLFTGGSEELHDYKALLSNADHGAAARFVAELLE